MYSDNHYLTLRFVEFANSTDVEQLNMLIYDTEEDEKKKIPVILNDKEFAYVTSIMKTRKTPRTFQFINNFEKVMDLSLDCLMIMDVKNGHFMCLARYLQNCKDSEVIVPIDILDAVCMSLLKKVPLKINKDLAQEQHVIFSKDGQTNMPMELLPSRALECSMRICIEKEDYEKASQIRDEINRRK